MKYWQNGIHDTEVKGSIPISQEEWDGLVLTAQTQKMDIIDINGFPTLISIEEIKAVAQAKREQLFKDMDWRKDRHRDEVLLGLDPTEDIMPILEYLQALRDITKQEGFPGSIVWPEVPVEKEYE